MRIDFTSSLYQSLFDLAFWPKLIGVQIDKPADKKLRRQIILTLMAFSVLPLVVRGGFIHSRYRASDNAKITETLKTLAENRLGRHRYHLPAGGGVPEPPGRRRTGTAEVPLPTKGFPCKGSECSSWMMKRISVKPL